jgi:hypothetical protein
VKLQGNVALVGDGRNAKPLVGHLEGKILLGRHGFRWVKVKR